MVLLVFVVPQFQSTFAQAGKALPLPTQVVIVVGTFLRNWWWAAIPAVRAAVAWFRRRGRDAGGAPRARRAPAAHAAARRPDRQGRDRALRAHARRRCSPTA